MSQAAFIRRVCLRHYKSIATCDVQLAPLTMFVGPNGAGKSNFLDALKFVRDALRESLEYAVRTRGGINEVRRRSGGHPTNLAIRLEFSLDGLAGHYVFELGALSEGGFKVVREQCVVQGDGRYHFFRVNEGTVEDCSEVPAPPAVRDRLCLVNAAGLPAFRPLYDALSTMGFYNLNPKLLGDLQDPDEGVLLDMYGGNLASVIARLERDYPDRKQRIVEYLSRVAPSVHGFKFEQIGPKHSLEFRQDVEGQKHPWRFWAASMSDGTLRALGMLTAVFQGGNGRRVPLVGIEEPETALHPAAAGILLDSLREATETVQVLVTTHSADLLDRSDVRPENLRAVVNINGTTHIDEIDDASKDVLKRDVLTAGELLRLNQLVPNPRLFTSLPRQSDLFATT